MGFFLFMAFVAVVAVFVLGQKGLLGSRLQGHITDAIGTMPGDPK